jgi:hypothetical protein
MNNLYFYDDLYDKIQHLEQKSQALPVGDELPQPGVLDEIEDLAIEIVSDIILFKIEEYLEEGGELDDEV